MPDAHYPINFVVKHQNLVVLSRRPALGRWETCRIGLKRPDGLFPDRRRPCKAAAIGKQSMSFGGAERDRTADLMLAKHALSQLSYSPILGACGIVVGLGRFELPTSPLSGVRSNQLSYRPKAS